MSIKEFDAERLRKVINLLDQALYNHQQWYNSLLRSLICKITPDQHDMDVEAHKQCRFGQWYYFEGMKDLKDYPGFQALGEEHMRMHQLSQGLLRTITTGTVITPPEYDNFSNSLERLRLELSTLKRELENYLYNHDPLTGTIARVNMLTFLRDQQELCKREGQTCYLVMMDLDHFKAINDQWGHVVGDHVLKVVAHYIIQLLRPQDRIFRYGGEEFLICLNNIEQTEAYKFLADLQKGLVELDIPHDPVFRITASFGIALLEPYLPVETSVEHADKALLLAKAAGRNCIHIWSISP